jgi:hypothetical protein
VCALSPRARVASQQQAVLLHEPVHPAYDSRAAC